MVETGPAILHGFALPTMLDLTLRARPEPACGQLRRASAHAAADIVAGDSQVRAVVVLAAQNDMPVEPGTEVALDLLHLSTSKGLEIAELERIVGRENETKLVAVTTTGLFKGTDVCLIRSEEHTSELQSLMRISYAVFFL